MSDAPDFDLAPYWEQSVDDVQSAIALVTMCSDVEAAGGGLALLDEVRAWLGRAEPERVVMALATLAAFLLDSPTERRGDEHLRALGLAAGWLRDDPTGQLATDC